MAKYVFLLISMLMFHPYTLRAAECHDVKERYAELNRPLRVDYAGEQAYLSVRDAQTEAIHRFMVEQLLNRLNSGLQALGDLKAFTECVQSLVPENSVTVEVTNFPLVLPLTPHAAVAVGYQIYRGWSAVPDDRYYFEAFGEHEGKWRLDGSIGSSFDGSTLFVQPIDAGKSGENWFLFSGIRLGNTGGILHLEVVSYDGKALKSVWTDSLPRVSLTAVYRNYILLDGEATNASGHYFEFRKRLDVVPSGLKEHTDEPKR
ncbi:MAG TPA: hypothetical protein VFI95_05190 [Terriglobales bacterium]|nr:hypothetical protein [Terriglobales bacterium]